MKGGLQLLLESTSDINTANDACQTALHVAVRWGEPWLIKALLDAGANSLAMDRGCYSPVCYSGGDELARVRTLAEALAVIAVFRDNGFTDETVIDEHTTALKTFQDRLRDQS